MSVTTESQLEEIRSMMASGHRSVTIEKHTLLIWGLTSAALIVFLEFVFAHVSLERWLHNVIETAVIAVIVIVAAVVDFRMTKQVRRKRGETLSFVQIQVTKIWWFLIGLIVFVNLGMNFFGGGYIFYPVLIFILGLAFYVHGLFSSQMYSWLGVGLIVLAAAAVVLQVPYFSMRWLAIFVLGLGFPLIAWIKDKPVFAGAGLIQKFAVTSAWLLIMVIPSAVAFNLAEYKDFSATDVTTLEQYALLNEAEKKQKRYVRIPAGQTIPIRLAFAGKTFVDNEVTATVPVKLNVPIEIAFKNGKALGPFRLEGADRKGELRIRPLHKQSHFYLNKGLDILMKYDVQFSR